MMSAEHLQFAADQLAATQMRDRAEAFIARWKPRNLRRADQFSADLMMLIQSMHQASAEAMGKQLANVLMMMGPRPAVVQKDEPILHHVDYSPIVRIVRE